MALKTLHSALLGSTFLIALPLAALSNDNDLTAQQRFDALKQQGIFAGVDGAASLDQPMNRAKFARVASLLLGLDGIANPDTNTATDQLFSDVQPGLRYTEEIAAAKETGLLGGNSDGRFDPRGDISVQQLAVMAAGLLGLEPIEEPEVEGASPWAAGYVKALIDAGVDFPTDYTQPATRAHLVDLAFTADSVLPPQTQQTLLQQLDKSLLKPGFTSSLTASGGETTAISYYQDPSKDSAAVFNPDASNADGLAMLTPGSGGAAGAQAYDGANAKLSVLTSCARCTDWPSARWLDLRHLHLQSRHQ